MVEGACGGGAVSRRRLSVAAVTPSTAPLGRVPLARFDGGRNKTAHWLAHSIRAIHNTSPAASVRSGCAVLSERSSIVFRRAAL